MQAPHTKLSRFGPEKSKILPTGHNRLAVSKWRKKKIFLVLQQPTPATIYIRKHHQHVQTDRQPTGFQISLTQRNIISTISRDSKRHFLLKNHCKTHNPDRSQSSALIISINIIHHARHNLPKELSWIQHIRPRLQWFEVLIAEEGSIDGRIWTKMFVGRNSRIGQN